MSVMTVVVVVVAILHMPCVLSLKLSYVIVLALLLYVMCVVV